MVKSEKKIKKKEEFEQALLKELEDIKISLDNISGFLYEIKQEIARKSVKKFI